MTLYYCCSVTKSYLTLRPHGLQHSRLLCPPLSPGACSHSCPLSWWCYLVIWFSGEPFSFCLQSFPASGLFPVCGLFKSGGQSIEFSALASLLPMNTQDWSPLGWTGWISLQSKSPCSQESYPAPQFKSINSLALSFLHSPTLTSIHDHWKNHSLD